MTELAPAERISIETLLTEFAWRLDHRGDVGELFMPDARLVAPAIGMELHGRDAIVRHFADQPASWVTAHCWCNLRVLDCNADRVRFSTTQLTALRLPTDAATAKHLMLGESTDVAARDDSGTWRFVERRLDVVFPFDVDPRHARDGQSPTRTSGVPPVDGALYYVRSRSGEVNVARYVARHNLYFAVGDSIGYFPQDLGAIGRLVPLDGAFDD
jgi:SnoaL-like domain